MPIFYVVHKNYNRWLKASMYGEACSSVPTLQKKQVIHRKFFNVLSKVYLFN